MNVGIGLSVTNFSSVPAVPLDPEQVIADLFDAGGGTFYEGAWYDPSDLTTLYQDAAGTTPVTGTGQPVGLMLDKSKGLTLGSELVTNGTFDSATGWTLGTGWSIGSGIATKSPGTGSNLEQTYSFVVGKWYELTFDVLRRDNGAMQIQIGGGIALSVTGFVFWSTGTHSVYFTPNSGNTLLRFVAGSTFDADIDNVSLKELPGNHATQSTSAARPVLQTSGGLWYLDFDGVDDALQTATFTTISQPITSAIAARATTTYSVGFAGDFAFDGESNNSHSWVFYAIAGPQDTVRLLTSGAVIATAQTNIVHGVDNVILGEANDASSFIRVNATQTATPGVGSGGLSKITLGNIGGYPGTPGYGLDGFIYGSILIDRTLTAGEISSLESYLATKSGVTLP